MLLLRWLLLLSCLQPQNPQLHLVEVAVEEEGLVEEEAAAEVHPLYLLHPQRLL
jgi:hypothetical protein